jgi:diadenosine tetraphosphate (Ap4A) HIT family hydrolase
MHLCPKYKGGDEWGGTFMMNPQKTYLTDKEYDKMIADIKAALNEV